MGKRTILVTGGAGFIGSHLVRALLVEHAVNVVNLDKLTYAGNLDSLADVFEHAGHTFVRGDIGDAPLVSELLAKHRPAAVLHLAAESHVDRSIEGPQPFLETNVLGTFHLLQATLRYWEQLPPVEQAAFRFVHVSTDEVYGSASDGQQFTEDSPYFPNSPYAASKAASNHFARVYFRTYGLPVLTTACSNNYGPGQFPEKLIPHMLLNAVAGKPLPLYGDGRQVRDWLHVRDHCAALCAVLHRGVPGEVYNIGGGCERTNLDLVRQLCRLLDERCPGLPKRPSESLMRFVADRPGHDRRYALDTSKIARELGWQPTIDLEQGLRETIDWYLTQDKWLDRVMSGAYRLERRGLLGQETAL